jgi:hypothetical protein
MFEKEKARMRREADGLAAEAEAELKAEEEEAIAALRARRRERLKVVDEKRAEVRAKLEKTWVESQVRLREEHIEEEHMKLSLVSKAFGLFGRKQRPSVRCPASLAPRFHIPADNYLNSARSLVWGLLAVHTTCHMHRLLM